MFWRMYQERHQDRNLPNKSFILILSLFYTDLIQVGLSVYMITRKYPYDKPKSYTRIVEMCSVDVKQRHAKHGVETFVIKPVYGYIT